MCSHVGQGDERDEIHAFITNGMLKLPTGVANYPIPPGVAEKHLLHR